MFNSTFKLCRNVLKYIPRSFSNAAHNISVSNIIKTKKKGDHVKVQGWVKSLRKMKENVFIDISDGSCAKKLQVILQNSQKPEELSVEASVEVSGVLNTSPKGDIELSADNLVIRGNCDLSEGYPFLPRKKYAQEYVRSYPHIRGRTNVFSSVVRLRNQATLAIHEFLNSEEYILVNTPILTANDCEGAGETFRVVPDNKKMLKSMKKDDVELDDAFFNKKVFLTVSGQLHLEAMVHGLSKVYTFGPTFRAENSKSRLHLSEFYMLEVETAFLDELEQLLANVEHLFVKVTEMMLQKSSEDIQKCLDNIKVNEYFHWLNKKFPVIDYSEAVDILKKHEDKYSGKYREDVGLTKEHELFLVKHCDNMPTFIINFPKGEKPFYMRECKNDSSKVSAFDLIVPNVGEVIGGSLRENNYKKLQKKLPSDNLNWYLDLRKYGGVPTGGYGLGFERYLQFLCNINSIKDVIPFPRWPHSCSL